MSSLDALDARILLLFAQEPKVGVLEASRRLGVARGTVQARLDGYRRAHAKRARHAFRLPVLPEVSPRPRTGSWI